MACYVAKKFLIRRFRHKSREFPIILEKIYRGATSSSPVNRDGYRELQSSRWETTTDCPTSRRNSKARRSEGPSDGTAQQQGLRGLPPRLRAALSSASAAGGPAETINKGNGFSGGWAADDRLYLTRRVSTIGRPCFSQNAGMPVSAFFRGIHIHSLWKFVFERQVKFQYITCL
jgi:hypothetical protein